MHTPAGFEMINGQAHVTSWMEVIFNPSFPYRMTHMLIASGLTVGFLLAGISAFRWLRNDRGEDVMATLKTGVYLAALLIPLQIVVGDLHGLNTLHHQPAKIAAMEGIWQTQRGAPAVLFAWPDQHSQSNRFEIAIPRLASFYLTHDFNGEVKGINEFGEQHPPVAPVFWAFRTMVGTGLLMLAASWLGAWQLRRRQTLRPWLARVLVAMTFSGWLALISGWYVTEIGRQPWLVSGLLTAAQAASKVPAANIALTLTLYLTLYAALLVSYVKVVFHLARKAGEKDKLGAPAAERGPSPATTGVQHA
jgi:cytochrome d ubiquinol oxidase subunit I